jgi:hypothetical protein
LKEAIEMVAMVLGAALVLATICALGSLEAEFGPAAPVLVVAGFLIARKILQKRVLTG